MRADEKYIYKTYLMKNPAQINIDGNLSDWGELKVNVQSLDNGCVRAGNEIFQRPSSSSDLSANFRCFADLDNFYVAVVVKDDKLVFGRHKFGAAHLDDSVEVYFCGNPAFRKSTEYDSNDAEIRFSKNKKEKTYLEGMGLFHGVLFMYPGLWESLGIEAAIKETPEGYAAELKVPRYVFVPFPLEKGSRIGFNVMVNDDDTGKRDNKISWTEDFYDESWKTTRYFGILLIEEVR